MNFSIVNINMLLGDLSNILAKTATLFMVRHLLLLLSNWDIPLLLRPLICQLISREVFFKFKLVVFEDTLIL